MPETHILTDLTNGFLKNGRIAVAQKTVGDLAAYWSDRQALLTVDPATLLYETQTWLCSEEGTEGALLWGNTKLMPGKVGEEFFMTRGHWHLKRDRGEICLTVSGSGALLLMDEDRNTRSEEMLPGTTHYVPGFTAHRTVNTGDEPLVFLCCWPADCGHEYSDIERLGFSSLLLATGEGPRLTPRSTVD